MRAASVGTWRAAGVAVVALLLLPLVAGEFWAYQMSLLYLYAIAALGVGLCWGRAGFLPLGQGLFFGLFFLYLGYFMKGCSGGYKSVKVGGKAGMIMGGVMVLWGIRQCFSKPK